MPQERKFMNGQSQLVMTIGRALLFGAFTFVSVASAQNVGIGFSNPLSKLTVNGNFAVGANYNVAAPANGALIQGITGIGTTTPDSANSFLTVASTGQSNITLLPAPASGAPNIRSGIFFGSAYFQCTDSPSNGTKDLTFFNIPTQTNVLTLSANNGVGIITTTPRAPLEVGTFGTLTANGTFTTFNYINTSTLTNLTTSGPFSVSAIFAADAVSFHNFTSINGTLTGSDSRLKNIIGRSDSAKDLETLKQIAVTDYTMKDTVQYGSRPSKKVIAQQVEKVYPTAVRSIGLKGVTFTPDIYSLSDSIKSEKPDVYTIRLKKAHGLKDGETVRLITQNKNQELNVVAHVVDDEAFTVETKEPLSDKVFVYGKECTDLKAVDYDAISMLNVSATQELAKKVETLEQENSDLHNQAKRLTTVEEQERATIAEQNAKIADQDKKIARLDAANAKLAAMTAEMQALKKVVATMQRKENGGVRTVALEQ
jgi:Chaperone of endosialidase